MADVAFYKPGDVVSLKSGGPLMTVFSAKDTTVWCMWFSGNDMPQEHQFQQVLLRLATSWDFDQLQKAGQ